MFLSYLTLLIRITSLDGRPAKQMTNFATGLIFNFTWSYDGKQLVLARGTVNSDVILISNVK